MKKDLLVAILLLIAGSATAQQLVLGSHDVVRTGDFPQDAFLIESDANSFYRVSGASYTSSDHPLLGDAVNPDKLNIYFLKYDKEGVPLKSNYIQGTNKAVFAGSFGGGFTIMAAADQEVDASGTIIPIPQGGEVEFIASYDPDCQMVRTINIWALADAQFVDSKSIMDPEDGSIYVYGKGNMPMELRNYGPLGAALESPNSYFYLIKYNQDLDLKWVYQIGFDMAQSGTSPYFGRIQVFPGNEGGVLITGAYGTESSPLINGRSLPGYTDTNGTFAVLLDESGQPRWDLDGNMQGFGSPSRIFKAFPMHNGDFVLVGNTNTGYYKLGQAEFIFSNTSMNNQFVCRLDPAGNPLWVRHYDSQGPVQEGKKKSTSSQVLDNTVFYDAIAWKKRLLYVTAPFSNPAFWVAGEFMNLNYPNGIYVAALDLRDGSDVWGYALSSDETRLHGFDVDRSGNLTLMGYNYATQDLDGVVTPAVVPGSFVFHVGLDYNGNPLWYNNASLLNPPYSDLSGVDLEVLPNGEVFSSMNMFASNGIAIGESQIDETAPHSSWLVELASDVVLGGRVTDANDNPVYPGYVKAIKSAWWGIYPTVDSALLEEDGTYLFDGLYPGNYALMVVPDRDQYPEDLCTYTGDQTGWKEASFLDLQPKFNSNTVDIKLLEISFVSPGLGSLSGTIVEEDEVESRLKGTEARPAKKASVVLLKKNKKSSMAGEVIAYVETDDFGVFTIPDVPDGEYLLHVEVAGLDMLEIHDVTIVGNQIVSGLDYTISEDGIYIGYPTGVSLLENESLQVYPNPGPGLILMDLPAAGVYSVRIYAMDGRMILEEQFHSSGGARTINISEAGDGVYIIRIHGPETDETLKYIKK